MLFERGEGCTALLLGSLTSLQDMIRNLLTSDCTYLQGSVG